MRELEQSPKATGFLNCVLLRDIVANISISDIEGFHRDRKGGYVRARIVVAPLAEGLMIGALHIDLFDRPITSTKTRYLVHCTCTSEGFYPDANILRRWKAGGGRRRLDAERAFVTKIRDAEALIRLVHLIKEEWETVFRAFQCVEDARGKEQALWGFDGSSVDAYIKAAGLDEIKVVCLLAEFRASDFTGSLPRKLERSRTKPAGGDIDAAPSLGRKCSTVGWGSRRGGA